MNPLQNTLGANDVTSTHITGNATLASIANRHGESLERALCAVVVVITVCAADVEGDTGSLCEALQAVRDHLGAQIADLLALEAEINNRPGPTGEIDDSPGKRFVEGRVAASEPLEGLACAECLCEGLAESEECIFCCVVVVDCSD